MAAEIPESHRDLIEDSYVATVVTVMPDGQPQATVVWTTTDNGTIKFSTTKERQKTRNLEHNPKVTLMVIDPQNVFRYLEVRGEASISEDGAYELIDKLAQKYTGKKKYYGDLRPAEWREKEERVIVSITPEHVVTNG